MSCSYEELAHTAEVGIRVRAATPADLFACAAVGMFALIGALPLAHTASRTVVLEAQDGESLLVDWLSELLFLHETTGEVYDQVEIGTWEPRRLQAVVKGGRPAQPPQQAIKAVTYHGLRLGEEHGAWLAEVYFDV